MARPMFPMRDFDQQLSFEAKDTTTRNELNEAVGGWQVAFKAWARVRPVTQRDDTAADTPLATGTYLFTLRGCCHQPAAVAQMRVQWGGITYYVIGEPLWLDSRRYLQVRATSQKVNDV